MLERLYRKEYLFVCDTSFLLAIVEKRIFNQLFERYIPFKLLIPESVLRELDNLSKSGTRRMKVEVLKHIMEAEKRFFEVIPSKVRRADEDVINIALDIGGIVATADKEVRRKASEKGLKTLFIRDSELYIS